MGRLFLTFAILLLILMYIDLNESKPLMLDALRSVYTNSHGQNSNLEDIHSWSTKERIPSNERQRRNCFLYAMKSKNRASKWMCW